MSVFTSAREKRLWFYALLVLLTIISTLVFGWPLAEFFGNQNMQAVIFVLVMLIIGTTILIHAFKSEAGKSEIIVWLGLAAVYIMLFLRLGLAERSHLMEYSVLAIFIHMAIIERVNNANKTLINSLIAFSITFLVGILDECMQLFIPDRVFDKNDIIFNGFAAFMAIGARLFIHWIRKMRSMYLIKRK